MPPSGEKRNLNHVMPTSPDTSDAPDDEGLYDNAVAFFEVLADDIGLPPEFFTSLKEDSDWTFIIKIHALLETGLNNMLVAHFKTPALQKVFSRLDTSNSQQGKIAFIKAADLLNENARQFIKELSEIRNLLLHHVKNFGFSITDHAARMDGRQRTNWLNALSFGLPERLTIDGAEWSAGEVAHANPRYAMWCSLFAIMEMCVERHYHLELNSILTTPQRSRMMVFAAQHYSLQLHSPAKRTPQK